MRKGVIEIVVSGTLEAHTANWMSLFYVISDAFATHLLAFIGGYIDAAGYLKLQGVFTSSITGNLVVACSSVSSLTGVICRSCVCISFFLSGGLAAAFAMQMKLSKHLSQSTLCIFLFLSEILTFVAVWIAGLQLVSFSCPEPRVNSELIFISY